jgi:hypothetical protein
MALLPGQDVAALGDDDFFGYGVDAGTGTLATYVGRTEDGRIAGFVTDFRFIPLE